MTFPSVEARMAHTYLDKLPAFVPDEAGPDVAEQRRFYELMRSLYQLAYDEPTLFVPMLHEDDAFPNRFNKNSYGKPELLKHMRKFTGEMTALLEKLYLLGQGDPAVKLSKRQMEVLSRLGIQSPLPPAWVWMATRPGASLAAFSHCLFKPGYPYMSGVYARLLGDEAAFHRLEGWMFSRGYRLFECMDVTASDDPVSITYANPAWSGEAPHGGFEYKVRHTGVSMRYDTYLQTPPVIGLCVPGGMKPYLNAFGQMDEGVKRFVLARTKHCDNCRYCVQTDKTGKRPQAIIQVRHEEEEHPLCPYFPGYSYCWSSLDDALVNDLIAMLSFMDGMRPQGKLT